MHLTLDASLHIIWPTRNSRTDANQHISDRRFQINHRHPTTVITGSGSAMKN